MGGENSKPSEIVQIHMEQKHLEASQGRFAEVRGPSIVFKQVQVADTLKKVTVHKKTTDTSVQMAFSFLHKDRTYFLAVEGNTVTLKEKKTIPPECFLQWKPKSEKWGILESVAHRNNFLYIQDDKVTISSTVSTDHCLFRLSSLKRRLSCQV